MQEINPREEQSITDKEEGREVISHYSNSQSRKPIANKGSQR